MPTSVRLDPKTESLLSALARKTGRTKSQVIRQAIESLARSETSRHEPRTAYEALAHVIGCARGGPRDLSERTGEKVRAMLAAKRRS